MGNMPIYDEIKKKFVLPDAHEDWKDYRLLLTDNIVRLGSGDKSKTVSVIGAGRCNDIDLHRLCRSFEQVTLADCDSGAMGEAIRGLDNPEIWKMHLVEMSLTGIREKDISVFCEKILADLRKAGKGLNAEMFQETVFSGIESLKSKMYRSETELLNIIPKSDIILCNGVFSQLFSTISFFIRSCAASLSPVMIPNAMETADKADEWLKAAGREIIPVITESIIRSAKDFAVFGNEYSENNPVEGACRCIEAVRNYEGILEETRAVWDFNRTGNVRYEMLLQTVSGKG